MLNFSIRVSVSLSTSRGCIGSPASLWPHLHHPSALPALEGGTALPPHIPACSSCVGQMCHDPRVVHASSPLLPPLLAGAFPHFPLFPGAHAGIRTSGDGQQIIHLVIRALYLNSLLIFARNQRPMLPSLAKTLDYLATNANSRCIGYICKNVGVHKTEMLNGCLP